MKAELIEQLKKYARRKTASERGAAVYDLCAGNIDDAYEAGMDDSDTLMSRLVLTELGIEW